MTEQRSTTRSDAARLARSHREAALARGDAVLVGNLAGVVEWTGDAWTRLTGFPLAETLDKPISHFLDRAGLEIDLVDFVAQRFLAGQSCTVESPFDTFDGRSIHVHLEVVPLRDEQSDITRFIAVAREIDPPRRAEESPATRSPAHVPGVPAATESSCGRESRDGSIDRPLTTDPASLCRLLERGLARHRRSARERGAQVVLDGVVDPALPRVQADPTALEALLDRLLAAAMVESESWPVFVTALAGATVPGRSHVSQVHPIPSRWVARERVRQAYLEIHDTGPHLDRDALARIRRGEPGEATRERALADAVEQADRLDLCLHLDSTPGCGTQALVLIPTAHEQADDPAEDHDRA